MKRPPRHYDATRDARFDDADHVFLITPTEEDPEGIEQALELLEAYADRRIKLMRTVFSDAESGETEVEEFPLEILPERTKPATQPRPKKRKIPDAFYHKTPAGPEADIPNNPIVSANLECMWKGGDRAKFLVGGWRDGNGGRPVYRKNLKRGNSVSVYPNTASLNDPSDAEFLWQIVEGLNPFTADVTLAILAQLCEPTAGAAPRAPLLESVVINADAILAYKGIQRYGAEKRILLKQIHDEIERLRALFFDADKVPCFDPESGKYDNRGKSWSGDRLFDIVKLEQYQYDLFGDKEVIGTAWAVRAGQWAQYFFNAETRIWVSRMAKALLEMGHQKATLGKKIGQHLFMIRGMAKRGEPLSIVIGNLLRDVGELPEPDVRGRNWAARTRDRFESGLLSLLDNKLLDGIEWPVRFKPGEAAKGVWVDRWLESRILIWMPAVAPETEPVLPTPTRTRPIRNDQIVDVEALKSARDSLGWTQERLAGHFRISRSYLSQIESGKRLPSKRLFLKITEFVNETADF